ncbi:MAG: glycosyl hydrolase [Paludibacter sp.]|nr:glycosyl hydrolase [Paludibacter sp.]
MKRINILLVFVLLNLIVAAQERTVLNISGSVVNTASLVDKEVIISGKTDLHVLAEYAPLTNSVIHLNSEDACVFFDNIRPQEIIDSVLNCFYVNGAQAVNDENIRVAIYRHGTVVMPQGKTYQPLTVYTEKNYSGNSKKYSIETYNNSLGDFENKIRSFKLKRGYMATLANNADGSGYSRVFIASDGDLEVAELSAWLDRTVSFIRVFRWEWVSKKGWCQTGTSSGGNAEYNTNKMNGTWLYTWSADYSSKPNYEYVPEKWQPYWPSWDQINSKSGVSHVMAFNEPDHSEQSNVSVATAVANWPQFMKSGLRIGSPACTDFSSWLYPFMDSIKAHNYRVDYVVIHAYWGGYTASEWYNALKTIHEKTGRPLWIKEWNNGATWTTESWPDDYGDALTKQYNELKAILNVMDTAHFVERYSIYNWVGYKRMLITDDGWVTPAGELYRDSKPPVAFNRVNEVIPTYKFRSSSVSFSMAISSDNSKLDLSWTNSSQEFAYNVVVERKFDDEDFQEIYSTNQTSLASYQDMPDLTQAGKYTYRVRVLLNNGTEKLSNEQTFYVIDGDDVRYGNLVYKNVGWNAVAFKNNYNTIPVVFLGAPTNNNTSILFTTMAKISSNKLMNIGLFPWEYQNVLSLSKDESLPYFVIKTGNFNFNGLRAYVSKTLAGENWKSVSFPVAFDTVPVVFVSLSTSNNDIPVAVRVRNITKSGFEVKLQQEAANTDELKSEVFAYMAIEQGIGSVNSNKIRVGLTEENGVGNAITQYAKITYGETIENPVFLAQLQTCNDDTVTATLRCRSVTDTEARVFKQSEKSIAGITPANETAGYILVNTEIASSVERPEGTILKIYPNPVRDILHVEGIDVLDKQVEIYDVLGRKVLFRKLNDSVVDVSALNIGVYILSVENKPVQTFIKK